MTSSTRDELLSRLSAFVQEAFLDGSDAQDITPDTPLLEWGILTSINTAQLLTHIRDEIGITIPPTELTGTNFQSLNNIVDLLLELRSPVS